MAVVQTFGVDQTIIESFLTQAGIDTDSPATPTRLTEIIESAAAEVCGVLIERFGDGAPADIAADSTTVAYRNCQRLVTEVALPKVLVAVHYLMVSPEQVQHYVDEAEAALDRLRKNPISIGWTPAAENRSPGVYTSTQALGLDTDTATERTRRNWDSRGPNKDEGTIIW